MRKESHPLIDSHYFQSPSAHSRGSFQGPGGPGMLSRFLYNFNQRFTRKGCPALVGTRYRKRIPPNRCKVGLHSLFAGRCTLGMILFHWKVLFLPSPTQTLGEVPGVGFTNSLGVPRAPISHVHLEPGLGLDLGSHRQSPLPFNIVSLSSSHCRSMNIQRASPKKDILQISRLAGLQIRLME